MSKILFLELTSSSVSLTEKAADESAGVISTSSISVDISPKARFQSSAKGPLVESLGSTPTFFYFNQSLFLLSFIINGHKCNSYPGILDGVQAFVKCLFLLLWVFSGHQNFHRDLATFQWFKVFCCIVTQVRLEPLKEAFLILILILTFFFLALPFFAVVTTYTTSVVNTISVAGNSYPRSQN